MVWFPIVEHNLILALAAAVVFGVMAAGLVEVAQRLMYARGDTHIDPPAASSWLSHTIVYALALLVFNPSRLSGVESPLAFHPRF